ncbi:MAG TPA: D-glycerate dehydrogenase [Magnetovibrio sp.]
MSKAKLFVTRKLPDPVEARITREFDATLQSDGPVLSAETIIAGAKGCDALLVAPGDPITPAVIEALKESVKVISTFSVGFDHIDLQAARNAGIPVGHTPDVLSDATADLTWLLLLAAARRAFEGEKMVRDDAWTGWTPTQLMGTQVSGKRIAILGMGRIGQGVAKRARGFDMEVHYHNRSRLAADKEQGAVYHDTPESLFAVADFLCLLCPLTPATKGLVNAKTIELLPKGAIIVNTGRGPVVDDEALIEALKSGRVAAAGLDVYAGEPKIHVGYRDLSNVFLLPHLGSATHETRLAMGNLAIDNIQAVLNGGRPVCEISA